MQATTPPLPQPGEWYSHDDLFAAYPGYWALLIYPNPLTEEEEWDIMATRGKLLAFAKDYDVVWEARRAFRQQNKGMRFSFFATEQIDDIILIA